MFSVVEYEGRECSIVPFCWLLDENTKCYWPKTSTEEAFVNLVKSQKIPRPSWTKYRVIKVFYVTETFEDAEVYLRKVIEQSSSSSDSGTNNSGIKVLSLKSHHPDDASAGLMSNVELTQAKIRHDVKTLRGSSEPSTSKDVTTLNSQKEFCNLSNQEETPKNKKEKSNASGKNRRLSSVMDSSKGPKSASRGIVTFDTQSTSSEFIASSSDEEEAQKTRVNAPSAKKKRSQHDLTSPKQSKECNSSSSSGEETHQRIRAYAEQEHLQLSDNRPRLQYPGRTALSTLRRVSTQRQNITSPPSTPSSLQSTITVDTNDSLSLDHSGFRQYLIKTLQQLLNGVRQNSQQINEILRVQRENNSSNVDEAPNGVPEFPMKDRKDFKNVEQFLNTQETNFQYLKSRLACIGGVSVRASVMHMMKFVMTNKLAVQYNWAGREKRPFKNTTLMKVIMEATRQCFRHVGVQDREVENAVKDWLKLAKSRLDHEKRRVPNLNH